MNPSSRLRYSVTFVMVTAILTAVAPAAGATSATKVADVETHCVVHVVGQEKTGEYLLGDEECYTEFGVAMDAAGLSDRASTPAQARTEMAMLLSTLAVHFDGANWTGSSLTVSGVDCLGGYINLSATWDNRISSTFGGICARIRHWSGTNASGIYQDTTNSGNLSTLNNISSSIQYLT